MQLRDYCARKLKPNRKRKLKSKAKRKFRRCPKSHCSHSRRHQIKASMISSRRFLPGRSCLLTLCVRSSRNMGRRQLTTLLTRRRLMRRRAKPIAWTIPSFLSSSGKRWRITAVKRPGRSLSIRPTSSFIWSRAKAARCVMALASAGLGFCGRGSRPVTAKRECPDWTPPAEMLARRPNLPRFIPGGVDNPLGARALSRLQPLPHPWLERAVDYRNQRVVRLRPHAQ